MTGSKEIQIHTDFSPAPNMSAGFTDGTEVFVLYKKEIDLSEEKKRLEKELKKLEDELNKLDSKLSNKDFIGKAPPDVVEKNRDRQRELASKADKIRLSLENLASA
jgi:valyl-tRNA synthetase